MWTPKTKLSPVEAAIHHVISYVRTSKIDDTLREMRIALETRDGNTRRGASVWTGRSFQPDDSVDGGFSAKMHPTVRASDRFNRHVHGLPLHTTAIAVQFVPISSSPPSLVADCHVQSECVLVSLQSPYTAKWASDSNTRKG